MKELINHYSDLEVNVNSIISLTFTLEKCGFIDLKMFTSTLDVIRLYRRIRVTGEWKVRG